MKKLNKKWIIIPSILLVIIGITLSLILFVFKDNNKHTYIAYVDINPLIKLNFKVSCDKNNNCSNPIVSDYELINEDAKTIYKDLVIKDKSLKETIELLANTVKDKDIVFKEIHIYSNYDNEEEFKVESTDYNITFDAKTDNDLEQFIDELVVKKENTVTKEILVPLAFGIVEVENKKMTVQDFEFLEQQDKIVEKSYQNEFDDSYDPGLLKLPEIKLDAIKGTKYYFPITIEGTQELLDSIPNEITSFDEGIKGIIDISGLEEGTHNTEIKFTSNIPEIIIRTQPIKIRVQIKLVYNNYFYTDENGKIRPHFDKDYLKELLKDGYITQERYNELLEKYTN